MSRTGVFRNILQENRLACLGNLSGYAWGTNVGWINFGPACDGCQGVTVDPATGSFDGYAWSENVGWIHFKNGEPAYNVVAVGYRVYLPVVLRNAQ